MRTDHPNAKLARNAMEGGSPMSLQDHLADDVVWHQVGAAEPLRGKQAVVDRFSDIAGMTFDFRCYDVVGDDDMVVAYGRAHITAGDRSTDYDAVEIYRMRDGRIAERYAMVGDTDAMERFWSQM